jgi:cell wall-associated NlpC family hydrolase
MREIGPPLTDAERALFVTTARSYLRTPFKHQGRSAWGLDCVGLCIVALRPTGRPYFDAEAYSKHPLRQGLRAALVRNLGEPVPKESMREGDVVLMAFKGDPSHVGILTNYLHGGFALLHAFRQMGEVVEHRMDEEWIGYITEVFRP